MLCTQTLNQYSSAVPLSTPAPAQALAQALTGASVPIGRKISSAVIPLS